MSDAAGADRPGSVRLGVHLLWAASGWGDICRAGHDGRRGGYEGDQQAGIARARWPWSQGHREQADLSQRNRIKRSRIHGSDGPGTAAVELARSRWGEFLVRAGLQPRMAVRGGAPAQRESFSLRVRSAIL